MSQTNGTVSLELKRAALALLTAKKQVELATQAYDQNKEILLEMLPQKAKVIFKDTDGMDIECGVTHAVRTDLAKQVEVDGETKNVNIKLLKELLGEDYRLLIEEKPSIRDKDLFVQNCDDRGFPLYNQKAYSTVTFKPAKVQKATTVPVN